MGIPLPALNVNPPAPQPGPMDMYIKAQQVKGLLLGNQLDAETLKGRQLSNQETQQQMEAQKGVIAAQHDAEWNPADPDTVVKVLRRYNVPLSAQANVVKGIGEIQSSLQKASTDQMAATQAAHSFFADQFDSAKAAPPDRQQSTYQQALANASNYLSQLPNGPAKLMLAQELAQAPTLYDQNWIDTQHALLKTSASLNEEALNKAQTFKAQQEGNLAVTRIPGARAQSKIEEENAALTPQQRAMGSNLFYQAAGGDATAQKAVNLETQQKVAAGGSKFSSTGQDIKDTAAAIMAGEAVPVLTNYSFRDRTAIMGELKRGGYNQALAEQDWRATQKHLSTLNGQQQERLRQAITFTTDSLPIIENLFDKWKGTATGLKAYNRAALAVAKQLPGEAGKTAQLLEAQISDLTSELGTVYKGGNSSTDESLALAAKNLKADWNEQTFKAAVAQIRQNLQIRKNSIMTSEAVGVREGSPYTPQNERGGGNASGGPETGYTRIKASDGSLHDIPTQNLGAARKRDPRLQVVQ